MSNFQIDPNYVDVAERIAAVRGEAQRVYPEGSFQPADLARPYTIETIGEQSYVVYVAAFYRTPDDLKPGIGAAWEIVPGRTPYTKHSELQNAETSAWGRALVAALAADTKRGIASAQEMRSQSNEPALEPHVAARVELSALLKKIGKSPDDAAARFKADGHGELGQSTNVKAIKALTKHYADEVSEK